MKHFAKLALGAFAFVLAACSAEEPVGSTGGDENESGDFYATIQLRLPSAGTRAEGEDAGDDSDNSGTTSTNAGVEFGQDSENAVNKILVVLATYDESQGKYKLLTSAQSDARPGITNSNDNTIKYVLNFDSSALKDNPLGESSTLPNTENVYVFTYCNPTEDLVKEFEVLSGSTKYIDNLYGTIKDKDNADIWAANKFLMSNKEIVKVDKLPSREDLVNNYNTPEKAFDLGTVKVVRAAARFDFQITNDNKYEVKDIDGETLMGTVELTDMALFNIQKSYFYLPRTSEVWTWVNSSSSKYALCGDLEGYVMSFNDGNFKTSDKLSTETIDKQYFSRVVGTVLDGTNANKNLVWTSIKPSGWNNRTDDNHNSWSTTENTNYKIWRYTTENTIPGTGSDASNQRVGISTGVVFRAEFTPENRTKWNGNVVYVYNNIVYGDLEALRKYVKENPDAIVAKAYESVSNLSNEDNKDNTVNYLDGLSTQEHNGFTAYVPTEKGKGENAKYRMYYFYYNRHNSNGKPSVMGTNEFGVVRNNVYKLAVTTVNRLGEPKPTDKPEDPNEPEKAYFTVSCIVMPWTVRLNNIEF